MRLATLRSGLNEMNISLDDYSALEKLRDSLINMDIDKNYMYRCMLAKALGIVSLELKEQAESLVSEMLQKTPKHRQDKGIIMVELISELFKNLKESSVMYLEQKTQRKI